MEDDLVYFAIVGNSALSEVGESKVGEATQLKPQVIEVKLRPGNCRFSVYKTHSI